MIYKSSVKCSRPLLRIHFGINHIKNMHEQNIRVQAEEIDKIPLVIQNDRVYKPTYTIQFDREGEVLLYSGNPIKNATLYFKYPYILYQSLIPLAVLNYVLNPFTMVWYWTSFMLYACPALTIPRIWYFSDFKYCPIRLTLLRGGRVLKVQSQTPGGDRFVYWLQTQFITPLTQDQLHFDDRDEADFLTQEGQLKYDLTVEVDEFKFLGVNTNDQQLYFKQHGTVHHPQLFQAAMKGFNIDTTDFAINTADNFRARQSNYDL